jgi:uncharacterized protein YdhG (YjbR/CyaY superfamily)
VAHHIATIDDYISAFPADVQVILDNVRLTILDVVPGSGEAIRYQMPTITADGRSLVHFAAWKHHVSVYPVPTGDETFEQEIAPYRAATSTARFPLREPIPYALIERLVALLVEQRERGER